MKYSSPTIHALAFLPVLLLAFSYAKADFCYITDPETGNDHERCVSFHGSEQEAIEVCRAFVAIYLPNPEDFCGGGGMDGYLALVGDHQWWKQAGSFRIDSNDNWHLLDAVYTRYYLQVDDTQSDDCEGDPCDPANGTHYQKEIDLPSIGNRPEFYRIYNSRNDLNNPNSFSGQWTTNFSSSIGYRPNTQSRKLLKSGSSASASEACTAGWSSLKNQAFRGLLKNATANLSGMICEITLDGEVVANLPVIPTVNQFDYAKISNVTQLQVMPIMDAQGKTHLFFQDNGSWHNQQPDGSALTLNESEWTYTDSVGNRSVYDDKGQIIRREMLNGLIETFTYSNDIQPRLTQVTNNRGAQIDFNYQADESEAKLSSVTSGGETVVYEYYQADDWRRGNLKKAIYADGSFREYHYDYSSVKSFLSKITDQSGNTIASWELDSNGKVSANEVGGAGQSRIEFAYDDNANTTTVTNNSTGAERTYHFKVVNGNLKVSSISGTPCDDCGMGRYNYRDYYADGKLKEKRDWNGVSTLYTYNDSGKILTKIEAAGTATEKTTNFTYDTNFPQLIATEQRGNTLTNYTYNNSGQLSSKTITDTSDGNIAARVTSYTYLPNGLLETVTYPGGNVKSFSYEAVTFNLVSEVNSLGHNINYSNFNALGLPQQIVNENGIITTLTYDVMGRVISQDIGGVITNISYYPGGKINTITNPGQSPIIITYNARDEIETITDGVGNVLRYQYDNAGNIISGVISDESGNTVYTSQLGYDNSNRIISFKTGNNQPSTFSYDGVGNIVSMTDPNGAETILEVDALDRIKSQLNADLGFIESAYNVNDQVVEFKDPEGATTTYKYDALKNLLELNSPDSGLSNFLTDESTQIEIVTDARSITKTIHYDILGRLVLVDYHQPEQVNLAFSYDEGVLGIGHLTGFSDETGSTSYTGFDAWGNVNSVSIINHGETINIAYDYQFANQLNKITYPTGLEVYYTYNSEGKVDSIQYLNASNTISTLIDDLQYMPWGTLQSFSRVNNINLSRNFDSSYNIVSETDLNNIIYEYDQTGNILRKINQPINKAAGPSLSSTYQYDNMNRLIHAALPFGQYAYTYDKSGNRYSREVSPAKGLLGRTYIYNSQYQLGSNKIQSTDENNGIIYQYDESGNVIQAQLEYTYDASNRLTTVNPVLMKGLENLAGTTPMAAYEYNALGQRVYKHLSNGKVYRYVYGQSGQLLGEYTQAYSREYIWLDGQIMAFVDTNGKESEIYFTHLSLIGRPETITDLKGNIVWQAEILPFGNMHSENGSLVDFNIGFPGQYLDRESGRYYNYYRDYDPVTGRYIESDPIGLKGGVNTYAYVGGNPIGRIDFFGLVELPPNDDNFQPVWFIRGCIDCKECQRCKLKMQVVCIPIKAGLQMSGAGMGAGAGSLVNPGVGTAVGGAIGGAVGSASGSFACYKIKQSACAKECRHKQCNFGS